MSDDLKDLLISAVPPLPGPPDRLGAVAARVRRTRRRQYAGVFAAVILVVAASVTAAYAGTPRRHPAPAVPPVAPICPYDDHAGSGAVTVPPGGPATVTTVPRGANSVTLCVVAGPLFHPTVPIRPRTVTTGLVALVRAMNAPPGLICQPYNAWPAWDYLYVFVMTYPDGGQRLFVPPDHCEQVPRLVDAFLAGYRAERVARSDPAAAAMPACAATWPGPTNTHPTPAAPADALAAPGGDRDISHGAAWLPSPLAALTVCAYRYDTTFDRVALAVRTNLGPLRDMLNASAPQPGEDGDCLIGHGIVPTQEWLIRAVDVTGALAELRVSSDDCGFAIASALGRNVRTPQDAFGKWIATLPR